MIFWDSIKFSESTVNRENSTLDSRPYGIKVQSIHTGSCKECVDIPHTRKIKGRQT